MDPEVELEYMKVRSYNAQYNISLQFDDLQAMLPYLETSEAVWRYSWFVHRWDT